MHLEKILSDEINSEFEELKKMELGTEKYKTTVDGLAKLIEKAIDINKFETELEEKIESRVKDYELNLQRLKEDKNDRLIRNSIDVAGILIPSVITIWGTLKTLKFEETGTVTTMPGRAFIQRIFPKII